MLTAHNLSKSYGLSPILNDITFSINAGDHVGLIGPNGCGKTTLLRLLTGEEHPKSGHISLTPTNLRVGYLAQGFAPDPTLTLGQLIHDTVGTPAQLEAELVQLATALAETPERTDLQQSYDRVLRKMEGGENASTERGRSVRFQSILVALGLDKIDDKQPVATFSGGQKTRLALAQVLHSDPQLLLLDEPTNHLDIVMLEWLEEWLRDFPGGVLIVSHDRTFLDRTVTRILDLNPHTQSIREYPGNYSNYLDQHNTEREKQMAAYKDQVYEIRKMKQDIARARAQGEYTERQASSISIGGGMMKLKGYKDYQQGIAKKVARKAKSRAKKLDRYLESDERVEKPKQSWQMKLDFDKTAHLGRDVLTLENLIRWLFKADAPLLRNLNAHIQKRAAYRAHRGKRHRQIDAVAHDCGPNSATDRSAQAPGRQAYSLATWRRNKSCLTQLQQLWKRFCNQPHSTRQMHATFCTTFYSAAMIRCGRLVS